MPPTPAGRGSMWILDPWRDFIAVSNPLVGIALFEIFHDVQYLTIVWIFNLNRADRNPTVGRFTRFLFRRS